MAQRKLFESDDGEREERRGSALVPLKMEHQKIIAAIAKAARKVATRPEITPRQLHDLSLILFALEMLPHQVQGIDVTLAIGPARNGESMYSELHIATAGLELAEGGVINRGTGGEAHRHRSLRADVARGACRGTTTGAWIWLERFGEFAVSTDVTVELRNVGDFAIDWDAKPDPSAWDLLDTDFPD